MYKERLIAWLQSQGRSYSISGKEFKTNCIFGTHEDRNPSFSINMVTGKAYCFSCATGTHADRILGVQQDEESLRISKYMQLDKMWEPVETTELNIVLPPMASEVTDSIRGISKELLQELGAYHCNHGRYKDRLIFPIRDTDGELLGFDARIHGDNPNVPEAKYLRPSGMKTVDILYPLDYLWNHREDLDLSTIVLTEGIMDAISLIQLGVPAVCNFGLSAPSPLKAGRLLSLGTMTLVNGLDNDQAAIRAYQGDPEKGQVGLKEHWKQYVTIGRPLPVIQSIRKAGCKDANEYLQQLGAV